MSAAPDLAAPHSYTPEAAERIVWRLSAALILRFAAQAPRDPRPPPREARAAIDRLGRVAADIDIALCSDDRSLSDILEEARPRLARALTEADAANIVPDDILSFLFDDERPW